MKPQPRSLGLKPLSLTNCHYLTLLALTACCLLLFAHSLPTLLTPHSLFQHAHSIYSSSGPCARFVPGPRRVHYHGGRDSSMPVHITPPRLHHVLHHAPSVTSLTLRGLRFSAKVANFEDVLVKDIVPHVQRGGALTKGQIAIARGTGCTYCWPGSSALYSLTRATTHG